MADCRAKNKGQSNVNRARPAETEASETAAPTKHPLTTEASNDPAAPNQPVINVEPNAATTEHEWAEEISDEELRRLEQLAE